MEIELAGRDGNTISADLEGPEDGPPVILLHGGGQTRHSWSGTLRVLADSGWRACSMDMRGHGRSEWPEDGDYTMGAFAADLTCVARTFERPPALVGASLGGLSSLVAIARADVQADFASSLVLVDVAHRVEVKGRERIGQFMGGNLDGFDSLEQVADAIQAYNPHRPRPTDLSGLEKNLRKRDDGKWVWHWDPRFITGVKGSKDETRSSIIDADVLTNSAKALKLPTLLVRGRSSDLLSEDGAKEFLEIVPQAEFADVAGAGHMVAGDRNEIFNGAVLDFLDRHRPS